MVSSRVGGTAESRSTYPTIKGVEARPALVDLDPSEQKVAYALAKAQYDQAVAQLNAQRPSLAITQADNVDAGDFRRRAVSAERKPPLRQRLRIW